MLHHLITRQAELRPSAPALVLGPATLSFEQLELESNRFAHALLDAGCLPGDRVAILLPKSIPAITAILGSLKAGCAYVPMDLSSPAQRLDAMIRAAQPRVLVTNSPGFLALAPVLEHLPHPPRLAWLDPNPEPVSAAFSSVSLHAFPSHAPYAPADASRLAHILFTSGSTGVPKGVMITHANVLHYVDWCIRYFSYQPGDRISGHPPLIFDLSTMDIFATLGAGATLYLITPEMSLLPHRLAEFIRSAQLTQWFSVPSLLNYMARFDVIRNHDFPALRRLLWCGEPFPVPALIHWMNRLPHVQFTNLYGPTEATIASSYYTLPAVPASPTDLTPIGQPCDGEELRVLDDSLQPVPPGQIGELFIGGPGLSPGYWQDPEKTAAAFIPDPLNPDPLDPGRRLYRTGDLASVDHRGLFFVHGRKDSQIKSRGYRIELGEIERALAVIPALKESAIVAIDTGGFEGATICCAYSPRQPITTTQLRAELAQRLPAYMLPALWLELPALPQNANGKIDRPALRQQFSALKQPATV